MFRYPLRMKLLMVSGDRSILQGKKGAFWYTLEEFSKHWDRVDVLCPRPPPPDPLPHTSSFADAQDSARERGSARQPFPTVFFHPSPRGLWYQPWWILIKGDALIKEHHHEVMTVHEYPPFYNGLGARWLHRATKIPYMTEIHHIVGYPKAANLIEWIGYWMSRVWIPRWGTSRAAKVRVVNQDVSDLLKKWGVPDEKLQLIYSLYLDFDLLKKDEFITKKFDAVFCGRFVSNKGIDEIVRAIAALPNATLLLIGDGPNKPRVEKLVQSLGVQYRVTFTGWLSTNAEVYTAIQSAKVFVMNSKSEGGPRIALEAMALGMPVICTQVGVMPEVIRDGLNEILTDGTAEGLAAKIRMLLGDLGMQERIGREATRILERFERRKLVREYAEFLKSLNSQH